jgi:hypothetical protein
MFKSVFLLIILSIILALPSGYTFSQIGTDIQIDLGINGCVRIGRWNPVVVSIRTLGIPFKGEIVVEIKEGSIILENIRVTNLKAKVDLPIYSKKDFLFLVPLSDVRHPVKILVFSEDGRLIKSKDYEIKSLEMRWPIIGLIGNNILPYTERDIRVTVLDPETISGKPFIIFDPLDLLILESLSDGEMLENIEKWIGWGGDVIVGRIKEITSSLRAETYPGKIDFQDLVADSVNSEVVQLPSKGFISLLLFIYILALVIIFYYLKKLPLVKILVAIFLSISFSIALFGITSSSKSNSVIMTQFNLIEGKLGNPYTAIYNGTVIFSPYSMPIQLSYNPRDLVFWVGGGREKNIAKTTIILSQNSQEENKIVVELSPDRKGILRGWGIERVNINAKFLKNNILQVDNNSPYSIREAYLLFNGKFRYLGDIKQGITKLDIKNVELSIAKTEGDKGRFLSWVKNNDIILSNRDYILGWIENFSLLNSMEVSSKKSYTLYLLEVKR